MDSRISVIDKMAILYRTGIKVLRGGVCRVFLKEAHGIFLVGKEYRLPMENISGVEKMLSLKIILNSWLMF